MSKILVIMLLILLSLPKPGSAGTDEPPLRFALLPYANPTLLHESFTPLARSLAAATGREVRLVLSPSYISLIRTLGEGRADIAFVGPAPYVKVQDTFGNIELLVRLDMRDESSDKIVIIARRDGAVKALVDLAGKTFAFGDYHSFGGHFMSRSVLTEHGVPPARLAAYDYVGSHDNVVLGVKHGDFDAGGLRLDIYHKYAADDLRVIHGPVTIPPQALVCRSSLPEELKDLLRQHLLALNDSVVLSSIDPFLQGFASVTDNDFDPARRVIEAIESR